MILGSLGAHSSIRPKVFIEHPHKVFIGKNVSINEGAILEGTREAHIKIGDGVTISYGVIVLTTSWALQDDGFYGHEHISKSVVIQDNAWIAARAVILPGITVGARSVVAAGSVVTHDVPPGTIVAGVPAKVLRHLGTKKTETH
jgi:acetyltransferase-like isoleucine patch superfamily enzyme